MVEGLEGSRKRGKEERKKEAGMSVLNLTHPYHSVDPETHKSSSLDFDVEINCISAPIPISLVF